jgi:hypothetical protein
MSQISAVIPLFKSYNNDIYSKSLKLLSSIFKKNDISFTTIDLPTIDITDNQLNANPQEIAPLVEKLKSGNNNTIVFFGLNNVSKKYILSDTHKYFLQECNVPILDVGNKTQITDIKNIALPVALTENFIDVVQASIKFLKPTKNQHLHIVSVMNTRNDFMLNKASQQLSILSHILDQSKLKYSAEIINLAEGEIVNSDLIIDHCKRQDAQLVVYPRNQLKDLQKSSRNKFFYEILEKSKIPILSFDFSNI